MGNCDGFDGLIMNGFYILLLILLKTFLVPLPNDLIRFGVPGTINSVLSMAEFSAAFELFMDYKIFYRGYFISTKNFKNMMI